MGGKSETQLKLKQKCLVKGSRQYLQQAHAISLVYQVYQPQLKVIMLKLKSSYPQLLQLN
eukprot:403336323